MKHFIADKLIAALPAAVFVVLAATPALASVPAPAPLAGALGPFGLIGACIVYGGYRLYKAKRKQG